MTLNPETKGSVKDRPDLPEYELGWQCMVPGCQDKREAGGGHHVWRRSHGTRSWWVELEDGTLVPNRVGLCPQHHKDITGEVGGHRARIDVFGDKLGWTPILPNDQEFGTIIMRFAHDPFAVLDTTVPPGTVGMQQTVYGEEVPHEQVVIGAGETVRATWTVNQEGRQIGEATFEKVEDHHEGLEPGTTCPTCKRRVNHPKKKTSPQSKVVSYRIPVDDAETHDEIAEAAAEALEKGFTKKPHWRWSLNTYAYGLILQGARMKDKGE